MLRTRLLALSLVLCACSPQALNNLIGDNGSQNTNGNGSSSSSNSSSSSSSSAASAQVDTAAVQSFQSSFENEGKTPRGAVKMLFKALLALESNRAQAEALLTVVLNGQQLSEDSGSPTGYSLGSSDRFLLDQMESKPDILPSYIGGTPEKAYADADRVNLPIKFLENGEVVNGLKADNSVDKEGATEGRLYIQSNGKDLPTGINMARNSKGLWKINTTSLSSIATGVKGAPKDF